MGRGWLSYPSPRRLIYPAAFLSGAAGLVYEVVWTRRLTLVLGSTTAAAAAVLSAFMLGLALGAVVVGGRADASRRPLRWYGLLELGLGVYALVFESLLGLAEAAFGGQPWLAAFALLAIPAALMGGTLPILARAGADSIEGGTRTFGGLYGINTLGAVAGALLATQVLMKHLGLQGSVVAAAACNIALGLLFWLFGMRAGLRPIYAQDPDRTGRRWSGDAGLKVLAVFFLAGFAGLALEMAWTRMLVYSLEGFTLAFGLMLAAYLLGTGAGALAGTRFALRSVNPRRFLGRILMVEGVLAIATFLLATPLGDALESMRRGYVGAGGIDAAYTWRLFLAAAAVICPATFCAGMLMPAVARIALSDRESIGRHTGAIYAATTLGAVVAPPIAGYGLIPGLGVPGAIAAAGALLLLGGTLLGLTRGIKEWVFTGAAAVLFIAICLGAHLSEPMVVRSHVLRSGRVPRRLLRFVEGRQAGVSVVEELAHGNRRLYLDGFSAAETGPQYGYMRMLGHLPMLLHRAPKKVCVIAVGTGTTAGAAAAHPGVTELVCVDNEPGVFEVADAFAAQNRKVFERPATEKVVADGRRYLARSTTRFDVITLEPLMPYTPAAVYLYTREFYELTRSRLAPGGLLAQWIPPQGVSNADLRRLIASMTAVFREVSVWYFRHAVLVVGSQTVPRLDWKTFVTRCSIQPVVEDLQAAAVGDAAHLLGAYVCSGETLRAALGGAQPFVDDRTDLEFRPLPRGLGKLSMRYHAANLAFLDRIHEDTLPWFDTEPPEVARALESGGAVLHTLAVELRHRVEGGTVVPAAALAEVVARDPRALFARTILERRRYVERMGAGRFEEAARLTLAPDRSRAYLELARAAEGKERIYYLTLAVRQNGLLRRDRPAASAKLLRELARTLKGPQRRFCLNRARVLLREDLAPGEERVPGIELPDLRRTLDAGDEEKARAILERARDAGLFQQVDRQAREWFRARKDKPKALGVLDRIGSGYTLFAALSVARRRSPEAAAAAAPILAARSISRWEALCSDSDPAVREAAADGAKGVATRAHLPMLVKLCGDPEQRVRLSAILALRDLVPGAEKRAGYDYRRPTPEALRKLAALGR